LRQRCQTLGPLLAHPLAYLLEILSVILHLVCSDRPTIVMSDENVGHCGVTLPDVERQAQQVPDPTSPRLTDACRDRLLSQQPFILNP
jgi:hypothetical protein